MQRHVSVHLGRLQSQAFLGAGQVVQRRAFEVASRPRYHAKSKRGQKPGPLRGIPLTPNLPRPLDPFDRKREWWVNRRSLHDPELPPGLRGAAKPPPPDELREALAKANGAKDKASDVEVQRLRRALDKSQQKLQHYEESNEGSLCGSTDFCPQALKSEILDAVRKEQEACKDRRLDARSGAENEPDTARTRVAHNDEPRPSKPAQGLQGTVIKVVKVPHTPSGHATSPSPMRPTSPLRKTRVIAMSPPTRVQLSPHPWRGRLTDTPGVSFREVPSSAAAMAAHAIAATAAMVGTPSRPLPSQSPPRLERPWPRGSSVTKPASPQVPHVASRSVATPAKRVTWTTPRC
eukprot:s2492_g1.t1